MLFKEALQNLEDGKYISRLNWKNKYCTLLPGIEEIKIIAITNAYIDHHQITSWIPTLSDLKAEDWILLDRIWQPVKEKTIAEKSRESAHHMYDGAISVSAEQIYNLGRNEHGSPAAPIETQPMTAKKISDGYYKLNSTVISEEDVEI